MYRVFLGVPSASELPGDKSLSQPLDLGRWEIIPPEEFQVDESTISHESTRQNEDDPMDAQYSISLTSYLKPGDEDRYSSNPDIESSVSDHPDGSKSQSFFFPPATLDEASRRISNLYRNVIFGDDSGEDEELEPETDVDSQPELMDDQTSFISWPPSMPVQPKDSDSFVRYEQNTATSNRDITSKSDQELETQYATQYGYSGSARSEPSISHFPQFHFPIQSLTAIGSIQPQTNNRKINVLLAVLEVEGPDIITIKNGRDAGKEVSLLKMILGDEAGKLCKLTAWREVADAWGGLNQDTNIEGHFVKRGDVVFVENVTASRPSSKETPLLTASPFMKSQLTICYRSLPSLQEDSILRPDLRLADGEGCVRRVARVVAWFEDLAGLRN